MQVRTKWHKLLELVREGHIYFTAPPGGKAPHCSEYGVDPEAMFTSFNICSNLPVFVFDKDLGKDLAPDREFHQSLIDLKEYSGGFRLPFPEILVETTLSTGKSMIAYLSERQLVQRIAYSTGALKADEELMPGAVFGMPMIFNHDADGDYITVSPSIISLDMDRIDGEPMIQINSVAASIWDHAGKDQLSLVTDLVESTFTKDAGVLAQAWWAVLLLLSTRGVSQEVIDPVKLNQHRSKTNKVKIPRHTYIHIGHVYKRDGTAVKYDERKSPKPHWRRAHLRNVRVGVGRKRTRPVWIDAMLVSYHGEEIVSDLRKPYMVTD